MEALAETNEGKTSVRKAVCASVSKEFFDKFNAIAFAQGTTISYIMKTAFEGFVNDYYSQGMESAHAQIVLNTCSSVGYGRFKSKRQIRTNVNETVYAAIKEISVSENRSISEIARILCENYVYRYENGLSNAQTAQDAPGMPSETGFRMLIDLA